MTVTDQLKIINNKIKANQVQCDVDRLAAEISALSSNKLRKYEYLTGEDLGYNPSVVEQAKSEYSPFGKLFNKGLEEEDKKEGVLKRLKNIEGKNKEQLKAIEDQEEKQLDAIKENNQLKDDKTENIILKQLVTKEEDIDYKKLSQEIFSNGFIFLGRYSTAYRFLKHLFANKIRINTANDDQNNFVFNLMKE